MQSSSPSKVMNGAGGSGSISLTSLSSSVAESSGEAIGRSLPIVSPTRPTMQPNGTKPRRITPLHHSSDSVQNDSEELGRNKDPRILESRKNLPIFVGRQTIIDSVRDNDTVIILGETGSGKTTQIPQYLFEAGFTMPTTSSDTTNGSVQAGKKRAGMIGITQPRRVAAISLAKRVAVEMGVPEPDRYENRKRRENGRGSSRQAKSSTVGYSIRFDDRTGQETRIKFMTDGWLLREMLSGGKGKGKSVGKGKQPDGTEENEDASREPVGHSLLEQYSVLIIDEAHERSVHTDIVLGLAKRIQRERKALRQLWLERTAKGVLNTDDEESAEPTELKVVIMSATIDAEAFAKFFGVSGGEAAPILYIKGRQFPIRLYHSSESCQNWMESCKKLIVQINEMPPGDVLIFMTGAEEIETFASELHDLNKGLQVYSEGMGKKKAMNLNVVKLYAALGGEAIRKCFLTTPPDCRKIILATNIAETSITISGIKYVIDCGLAKERTFRTSVSQEQGGVSLASISGASMDMLEIKAISKSAARQRAGRAGRESNGSCFRLYKEDVFENLPESTLPEILRTELSSVVLDVFAMGLNPVEFDWLDRPEEEGLRAAVVNLVELGALEMVSSIGTHEHRKEVGGLKLTKLGREMASLPLLPQLSKTLLSARDCASSQVFSQALDLVSILSTERRSILIEPSARSDGEMGKRREEADRARERLSHPSGDHATQLKVLNAFFEMQDKSKQEYGTTANSKGSGFHGKAMAAKVKEWCSLNFVNLKMVREALKIRSQLHRACLRQGWLPSTRSESAAVNGSAGDESDTDDDDDQSDDDLVVTRGGGRGGLASFNGLDDATSEDYSLLRRCLIQGKRVNTAFRQGESNQYQRAHGGSERFKIHPSSSLHFRKTLPNVIFFEDIFVSTQIFARTVSAAEASWLTDLSSEVKNRKSLHQAIMQRE
ncbi:hypothetical protein CBS101457_006581 [Exobasidium rhododendri]|nr:hypothetical protein CBS101457_006581 [Exobasidium rhododendri]